MRKLFDGVHKFKKSIDESKAGFYRNLANGQSPKAIFVTCSDSRLDPNQFTHTGPGDLFVIRNAGNIVPAYHEQIGGEAATIEYGVYALGIKDIVVCGHTHCGAVTGLLHPEKLSDVPMVRQWLTYAQRVHSRIPEKAKNHDPACLLNIAIQQNVLLQVENVKTLPIVARKISSGELQVHAWVYEIETGQVFVHSEEHNEFLPIEEIAGKVDLVKHDELSDKCTVQAGHHVGHLK